MGHLHLAHSASPVATPESSCLAAFEREFDYVFETLKRLGAGPSEVEDLAQDVFVVLYRHWATLDTSRPLRPYLFGVAFRIMCAHRRRRRRETPYPDINIDDDRPGPEGLLQSKEATALVLAALDRVPLPRRAVLVMHELDNVPVSDVAKQLSITRFGAYARLRKGRRELASALRRLIRGGEAGK
jgi:RNA polymerase sigma-70 factor, ECF subfamily